MADEERKEQTPAEAQAEEPAQDVQEVTLEQAERMTLPELAQLLSNLKESPQYKELLNAVKTFATLAESATAKAIKFLSENSDFIEQWQDTAKQWGELAPFIVAAIEELQPDLGIEGFKQLRPGDSLAIAILERAKELKEEQEAAEATLEEIEQAAKELPRIIAAPADLLNYPLDKPNARIWNMLLSADPSGQLTLDIDTTSRADKRKGKEAIVYYGISFDTQETGLTISKQLTPFDKRVYIAAAALYNAGNSVITATQIHTMMGNSKQPSKAQIQKINDSVTKMGGARVYINSTAEVKTNKGYPAFKYDAPLMPFERISAYINNTMADAAIHLFREPPLITFARERGQITSVTRKLLESPINKTDANLRLEDYLLDRISHMKNPKSKDPRKMLFSKIYEMCHIDGKTEKERKERQRTPDKIKTYLDHYQKEGFIRGYKMDKTGVTIEL